MVGSIDADGIATSVVAMLAMLATPHLEVIVWTSEHSLSATAMSATACPNGATKTEGAVRSGMEGIGSGDGAKALETSTISRSQSAKVHSTM